MSDMDGIGSRDEWYDERMVDDDMSVVAGLLDENALGGHKNDTARSGEGA